MATTKATKSAGFQPTLVHAYRRKPHMVPGPNGVEVEQEVEVVFDGERVKFKSNAEGHVVGLVSKEPTFLRLTKEIPEAYIAYQGGENVPAAPPPAAPSKPAGVFVLQSGDGEFKVLDDLSDEELRAFATEAGVEDDALPKVLVADDLRRAIYNLLTAGQ
jgi:hypothetical protein